MARGFRRFVRTVVSRFTAPKSVSRAALRRPLNFNPLEDRVVLTLTSAPDKLLPPGVTPLALALATLDTDVRPDLAVLGTDGHLTVALNRGDDAWHKVTTTDLGIPAPVGMALGVTDRDPFTDLVVQTPNGIVTASGDGQGRFRSFQTLTLGTAGTLAGPAGVRVDPVISPLGGDPFADIIVVAPGTNEVLVVRSTATGFEPAVRYATGGLVPVAVAAGQLIGDDTPDLAVGHRDGTVTFLEGRADGTFVLRSDLTQTGLGAVTGLTAADVTGDGELDLIVAAADRVTVLRNDPDAVRGEVLVNGDFARGLTGWAVTSGGVSAGGGFAQFREADALLSSLRQSFTVPDAPDKLRFDVTAAALEALDGALPDAFEVSLLDATGRPLVGPFRADATAFFNLNPNAPANRAAGVDYDGRRVTVNISGLTPGTPATLVFDLVGNKPGVTSVAAVDNVSVTSARQRVDTFTAVPLDGPFTAVSGAAVGDVDGDGKADVVVGDGTQLVVFNGGGAGAFTRSALTVPGAVAGVAAAPLTAGDAVADVAVAVRGPNGVYSPLTAVAGPALDQTPRLAPLAPLAGAEGTALTLTGTFTDPDDSGPYTGTVEWGDGSTSFATVTYADGHGTVSAAHTYADNATYAVRLTLQGVATGPWDVQETRAVVTNVAPTVTVADVTLTAGDEGEVTVGTFRDAGFTLPDFRTRETFLATLDWGDGTAKPFGRESVTDGSAGVATAGTVFGSHRYAQPGLYTATLTVTDDDGGTQTKTFRVTAIPKSAEGVWWVPGAAGATVRVTFDYLPSSTEYHNELGYYLADDAAGRVGGLAPGDAGYAAAALARAATTPIFTQADAPGASKAIDFAAGAYVGFVLVKDGTLANLLANNPTAGLDGNPLAWFSPAAANADGGYRHFQRTDLADGWVRYDAEDLMNGGDEDFNDLVFQASPTKAVQLTATIRDFKDWYHQVAPDTTTSVRDPGGYVDFGNLDRFSDTVTGLVAAELGPDGRPVYVGPTYSVSTLGGGIDSAASFAPWYRDTPGVNLTTQVPLSVDWTGDAWGYQFAADSFFPIDGQLFGNSSTNPYATGPARDVWHNYGFTTEIHAEIEYQPGKFISATGDDDLWVFINNKLAIDVGGLHSANGNFLYLDDLKTQLGLEVGEKYSFALFHAERHLGDSVVRFGTNANLYPASVPPASPPASPPPVPPTSPPTGPKFYVADGGAAETFRYAADGSLLNQVDSTPGVRGVAANAAGTRTWEADGAGRVRSYDPTGAEVFAWQANDVTTAEDVTVHGDDLWLLDAGTGRVRRYAGLAGLDAGAHGGLRNGGFETLAPGVTNPNQSYYNVTAAMPAFFDGWAVTDGNVDWIADAGPYSWLAAGGDYSLELNGSPGTGRVAQTIDTIPGATYEVTYSYAGNTYGGGLRHARALVNGVEVESIVFDTTGRSATDMGWTAGSFQFVAAGTATTLAFEGQDGSSGAGIALDDVAVAYVSGGGVEDAGFDLDAANADPTGVVTDGSHFWVTDRAAQKVFVYSAAGAPEGSWGFGSALTGVTGVTLDPTGSDELWLVDGTTDRVYRYATGRTLRSGTAVAATDSFALAAGNGSPQGIADPGPGDIAVGQSYSAAFTSPGEVIQYHLTVTDDQVRYALDRRDGTASVWSRVVDADDNVIWDSADGDVDWGTLAAGAYTVEFRDVEDDLSSFQFAVLTGEAVAPIATGAEVEGSLPALPDFGAVYTIAGTAGQQLFFDAGATSGPFWWELQDPTGGTVFSWYLQDRPTVTLGATGTYTLRVTPSAPSEGGDVTGGAYHFTVVDVPVTPAVPVTLGTPVTASLATPGEVDRYTFSGTEGDRVRVKVAGGANFNLRLALVGPTGEPAFADAYSDRVVVLTETGGYELRAVSASGAALASYGFTVEAVVQQDPQAIAIGQLVSDALALGDQDRFTFTAAAGQRVLFDARDGSGSSQPPAWRLTDAGGAVVFATPFADVNVLTLAGGDYTLTVETPAAGGGVGNYSFKLWDVPATVPEAIAVGDVKAGTIPTPGVARAYTFTGTAGQALYFDVRQNTGTGGLAFGFTLVGPGGTVFPNVRNDQAPVTLPADGEYTLTVDEFANGSQTRYDAMGSFGFAFTAFPAPTSAPIAVGTPVTAAVADPGQVREYTFTAQAGDRLAVDVATVSAAVGYQVTAPDGAVVVSARTGDGGPFAAPLTGTYTVRVKGQPDPGASPAPAATGSLTFTVVGVPADDTHGLDRNAPLAVPVAPGQAVRLTFEAAAGQRLLFDRFTTSDPVAVRVTGPGGFNAFPAPGAAGWVTLGGAGTYAVVVGGAGDVLQGGTARFQVQEGTVGADPTPDSAGTEFWLGFPLQYRQAPFTGFNDPANFSLFITADADTSGVVEIPGLGFATSFFVPAGETRSVAIPADAEVGSGERVDLKAVHVTALNPVTVYGLANSPLNGDVLGGEGYNPTADAFLGLPANTAGREYVVLAYGGDSFNGLSSQFTVVAHEDGTTITVTPTVAVGAHAAGVSFERVLNRGEAYNYGSAGNGDVTGSVVTADRPVSVFGSHPLTRVPVTATGAANFLVEQLPGVDTWGRSFVAVPFAGRATSPPTGSLVRVVAATDDTDVLIDGVPVTLDRGEVYEHKLTAAAAITASHPVLVGEYSFSSAVDGGRADPFFALVPPTDQFLAAYTVAAPTTLNFDRHFVTIVVPTAQAGSVVLDGLPVPEPFQAIGGTAFSFADVPVAAGAHHLAAAVPFGVTAYGYGAFDGYGYVGGVNLAPVNRVAALDLTPNATTGVTGSTVQLSAVARDAGGNPVAGVRVDFVASSVNPATGFAFTDTAGVAAFAYAGTAAGTDSVTATLGALTDTSTVAWATPTTAPVVFLDDPTNGQAVPAGQTLLVTGRAFAGTLTGRITLVTVNGQPVEAVDAAGRFFTRLTAAAGANAITAVARDDQGQTATVTISVTGVAGGAAVGGFRTTYLPAKLVYAQTTFNRLENRLKVDAAVANTGATPIRGPIAAAFRDFDPADVTLHGAPLSADGHPTARFDAAIPAGGTGAPQRLAFDDDALSRFDFRVDFLAPDNDPPVFVSVPRVDAVAGRAYAATALARDANGDPITYAVASGPDGFEVDPATGAVTWTPAAGVRGPVQVELEARDDRGGVARQAFQIDVRDPALNRAPAFRSVPTVRIATGEGYAYSPVVFDPDGDALDFAGSTLPVGFSLDATTGAVGATGLADGKYAVHLVAIDGHGGVAEQTFTLSVGQPATSAVAITSVPPDAAVVGRQVVYLPRATSAAGLPLAYALTDPPAGVGFDTTTGQITWTPTADQVGTQPFVLTASDGVASAAQTFVISVQPAVANRPPVITSRPPRLATQEEAYAYPLTASDPDGDGVTFSLSAATLGLGFTLDPVTDTVHWAPTTQLGTYRVDVTATDSPGGAVGRQSFLVDVRPRNTAPTLTAAPVTTFGDPSRFKTTVSATDLEGDAVRFALGTGTQSNMRVDAVSGLFIWDAKSAAPGTYEVTVLGTDEREKVGQYTLSITVTADKEAPHVAVLADPARVNAGQPTTIRVFASDNVGVTGRTLTVNGSTVALDANGTATFTPSAAGVVSFVATATDLAGNSASATGGLSVSDPTDLVAPTVTITGPEDGAVVSYLTNITGTVSDVNLVEYTVQVSRFDANEWRTVYTGTTPVTDGVLATLDPTLLDSDTYAVRVTATDVNGRQTTKEFTLDLTGQAKLGNFRQEFVDLTVPLAGIPVQITRVYDTLKADQSGDFGFGWSLGAGYDPRVREARPVNTAAEQLIGMFGAVPFKDGTRVYVNTPDGRRVGFTFEPKPYSGALANLSPGTFADLYMPYFKPDPGVFESLEGEYDDLHGFIPAPIQEQGGQYFLAAIGTPYNPLGYKLTTKDGLTYHFGQFDGLKSITDRNGVKLTFTPDGITSSMGPGIGFARDAQGRITAITDPAGNAIQYTYTAGGDLGTVKDQVALTTRFEYSASQPHFLQTIVDPEGNPVALTYAGGRLRSDTDAVGAVTQHDYDVTANTETITDAMGGTATLTYDDRGNVTQSIDPMGFVARMEYDDADNLTLATTPRGFTAVTAYDARGNVTKTVDALNGTSLATYDAQNKLLSATDPLGRTAWFRYDPRGNAVEQTNADGYVSSQTFDAAGRRTSITDNLGYVTVFGYGVLDAPAETTYADGARRQNWFTPLGQVGRITDERGASIDVVSDQDGRVLSVHNPGGGTTVYEYALSRLVGVVDELGRETKYEYDDAGRKTAVVDAANGRTQYAYDLNGNVTSETNALGRSKTWHYRPDQRVDSVTDALGGQTTYEYDANGNLTAETDALGRRVNYIYDALDRLTQKDDSPGPNEIYTYDAVGNVSSRTDKNGHVTAFEYDNLNRKTRAVGPDGSEILYAYDAQGQPTQETDQLGRTTRHVYDSRGREIRTIQADQSTAEMEYDGNGNQIAATDAMGERTLMTYDALGRLTSVQTPLGFVTAYGYDAAGNQTSVTDALGRVAYSEYDDLNRLVLATDAAGGETAYGYDAAGNQTSVTDALGRVAYSEYDDLNRLVLATDAAGGETAYGYDAAGNQTSVTDALGRVAYSEYDDLNRLVLATDAAGGETAYGYDAAGNQTSVTDALGRVAYSEYDDLNRLVLATDAAGGETAYGYDAAGNQTSVTDALGRVAYSEYDDLNRLVLATDAAGGETAYGYDAAGRQVRQQDVLGRVTRSKYDSDGRLVRVTDPAGNATVYAYDSVGNNISVTDPLGNVETQTYDSLNRVTLATDAAGGGHAKSYDALGNVLTETDPLGRVTEHAYDKLNRVVTDTDPSLGSKSYSYDAVGNQIGLTDERGETAEYQFDDLNRLIVATDPRGKDTQYQYDALGNRTQIVDRDNRTRTFAYDANNRLVNETWWAGTTTVWAADYSYDTVGNRLTASDPNSEYTTTYDALNRLATVDNLGTPTGPRIQLSYTHDAAGNVTHVADQNGIEISSAYDSRNMLSNRDWVTPEFTGEVSFEYDAAGRRIGISRQGSGGSPPAAIETSYEYDPRGLIAGIHHRQAATSLADYDYDYDLAGQLTEEDHHGQSTSYSYDDRGQLTSATTTGQPTQSYGYDEAGNRISGGQTVGLGNRLEADGQYDYGYDDEGNQILRVDRATGERVEQSFDYRNRLESVVHKTAGGILLGEAHYTYDVLDRLISRTVDGQSFATVYDGDHAWGDYATGGQRLTSYLYGAATDEVLGRSRNGGSNAWYLSDKLGTVRDLVDNAGGVLDHIDYSSFGSILNRTNPTLGDRFTFTGREFDSATGLYWYRARWYDPATGRFVNQDPLGTASGDWNFYRYVGNVPTGAVDPSGMIAIEDTVFVQRISGALISLKYAAITTVSTTVTAVYNGVQFVGTVITIGPSFLAGLTHPFVTAALGAAATNPGMFTALADKTITHTPELLQRLKIQVEQINEAQPQLQPQLERPVEPKVGPKTEPKPEPGRDPRRPPPPPPIEPDRNKPCFPAGTPIRTPAGWCPIEALRAGDAVLSRDEHDPDGAVTAKVVEEVFTREGLVWNLHVGGRLVQTTAEHPFYVRGQGWVRCDGLKVGDLLATEVGGWLRVEALQATREWRVLYNFRVADYHTYFVGCEEWGFSVWAHNACIVLYRYPASGQPEATKHWSIRVTTDDKPAKTNHTHLTLDAFPKNVASLKDWLAWHADAQIESAGSGASAEGSKEIQVDSAKGTAAYNYAETRRTSGSFKYDLAGRSCITYVAQVLNKAGYNLTIPGKGDVAGMNALIAQLNALVK
ncbi:fibro-slime domain-containing protein [Limnoglobus roseus]|uniref:RHS repeat-containing protein n=1 Tax=Limnoglobus roseus TaxID=2598579 RepID=A0A5C1AA12_9BACT|nr:fibro-slime domain-containing protein [Limnoglobus roseus]QEL14866.1 RHS repeat-containing protein [Limnoglobus roseus]